MVAVVMTYWNRSFQLCKTLKSIEKTSVKDKHIIIVDDGSDQKPIIPEVDFPVTILNTKDKWWTNPEPAYNLGIDFALGFADKVIIQNAECYHVGDILHYAENNINSKNYISFGCFSINEETTFKEHNIFKLLNEKGASRDGENAWYNHPKHRPVGYDFCSAITADNLKKLNGFDERLSKGCGYGDDYLLYRIKLMGLDVKITSKPFVVHQWHYNNLTPENKGELVQISMDNFEKLKLLNEIKAQRGEVVAY